MLAFPEINFGAVLVAAVAYFMIGWLWYSPQVLGKAWMSEMKLKPSDMKKEAMGICFGGSFVAGLLSAFVLAAIVKVSNAYNTASGANVGLVIAIGIIAPFLLTNYLYENRSVRLYWITLGYHLVSFIVMGAILGTIK